jgi:tol-pal system protein YbgF
VTRPPARMKFGPAALLLGVLALCGPAAAQSDNPAAQNELRFQQLEDQVRNLTGQVETQSHQIEVLTQQLEKLRGDTDLRLNDLEGKGGAPAQASQDAGGQAEAAPPPAPSRGYAAAPPQQDYPPAPQRGYQQPGYPQQSQNYPPPPPNNGYGAPTPLYPGVGKPGPGAPPRILGQIPSGPVPSADPAEVAAQTPQAQYQAAYALIGQGQFGAAQQAFQAFIAQNPRDPLASSASYWIGHSYYARGDFQNAAVAYADGYKKYPKGIKAPDTLLDLGKTLAKLDQVPGACATFAQFDKQFGAGATPIIKKQVVQEKTRLRCS